MTETLIDVSGLPDPVVADIRRLVDTLRERLAGSPATPPVSGIKRKPLGGRLAGMGLRIPTQEEIEEVRHEMWGNFPRNLSDETNP